jgi:signal transduction histidine kinase
MPPLFGDTAATLIVDDDGAVVDVLSRLLTREGYRCTAAGSAEEARARLSESEFAMALVDVMMPGESGLELAADMLADHPDVAVVMVTGVDDPGVAELALQSGAYGYLVKPVRPNELVITAANAGQRRCLQIERRVFERRLLQQVDEQATDLDDALMRLKHEGQSVGVVDAETERLASQIRQSQRLESLGQLAGGVAHDFNNLLGAIINYASFVAEDLAEAAATDPSRDWSSAQHDIAQIQRSADRAAQLTHQLLSFARREVVRPQVLIVNEVVSEVEQLLRRTIGEHVELATSLETDLWPVLADRGQIEQVLVNLAVNARDAMPAGGLLTIETANVTVDESYAAGYPGAQAGRHVRLRVSDTGEGMEAGVLRRAFEPYFTTKPNGEGSGLGLATVYGIITQAGGVAKIYSEAGIGMTFTALLPATEEVRRVAASATPPGAGGAETVLVVEDEEAMRDVVERILSRNGYRVLTAANGPAAIELVGGRDDHIDLLLTDVVMPQMLGKEAAERIVALRPDVKVLYMSGYAMPVLGAHGTLEEGVTLVEKPFSEPTLLAKVREVLDVAEPRGS